MSLALAGCGGGRARRHGAGSDAGASTTASSDTGPTQTGTAKTTTTHVVVHQAPKRPPPPAYPQLLGVTLSSQPTPFVPVVVWKGSQVAWISRSPSGVAMLSFRQPDLQLQTALGHDRRRHARLALRPDDRRPGAQATGGRVQRRLPSQGRRRRVRVVRPDGRTVERRSRINRHVHRRNHRHRQLAPGGAVARTERSPRCGRTCRC